MRTYSCYLSFLLIWFPAFLHAIPFRIKIAFRQEECMWDKLKYGDAATLSLFILEGTSLNVDVVLEGPIATADTESTAELMKDQQKSSTMNDNRDKYTYFREIVDFENLKTPIPEPSFTDDDTIEIDVPYDDDYNNIEESDSSQQMDMAAIQRRVEERRIKQEAAIRKRQESRRKREEELQLWSASIEKTTTTIEGSAYQKTIHAQNDGWFRGCVVATHNDVVVEVDFRSTGDLGGIDPETNHVFSYEKWHENQEEKYSAQHAMSKDATIQEIDFIGTINQLRDLKRALHQIGTLQEMSRHRLDLHHQIAKHSNSKLHQNSLLIAVLFMTATLYHIYSIQRWLRHGHHSILAR